MKIREVLFTETIVKKFGLKPVEMARLGKVVLIAGKNGAGKTRLLKAVQQAAEWRYENRDLNFPQIEKDIENLRSSKRAMKEYREIEAVDKQLNEKLYQKEMAEALQATAGAKIKLPIVHFVPKILSISPLSKQTLGDIADRVRDARQVGVEALSDSAFSYIYTIQRNYFEATHPNNPYSRDRAYVNDITASYKRLENLLWDVLDAKLARSDEGFPLLFGHQLEEHLFSEGQKVLLQLVVALHAQRLGLKDVIILLDEPENHLHSAVLIDIIDTLLDEIRHGQIWICTHSVPLIAHLAAIDPYTIWFMDNGEIKRAGRTPERILGGLLGKPQTIGNLKNFMSLPHNLALANFASQCLSLPQSVETGPKDPQLLAIADAIRSVAEHNVPLRVLDYGAGKGRLLSGLQAQYAADLRKHIDYYAFDSYPSDKEVCTAVIANTYESVDRHYHNDFEKLVATRPIFDIVVLTNVLHEIDPHQWKDLFSDKGLQSVLSQKGWILIVEDQRLSTGEKAHDYGFILLDTDHLKTLFGIEASDEREKLFMWTDYKGNGRIKAHLIHASLLGRFNSERQRAAITQLRRSALAEIKAIRSKQHPSYDDGQLHGLWTQLYANASLFLEP